MAAAGTFDARTCDDWRGERTHRRGGSLLDAAVVGHNGELRLLACTHVDTEILDLTAQRNQRNPALKTPNRWKQHLIDTQKMYSTSQVFSQLRTSCR